MNEVTYRRANLDDAGEISAVYVKSASAAERGFIPDHVIDAMQPGDYFAGWIRRLGSPPPHATWIAERAGEIVGFSYVEPDPGENATPETGHLDMLFVLPEHAGQGIGARLLDLGMQHLAAAGCTEATLWALDANERTKRFYRREGWRETDVMWRPGDEGYVIELRRMTRRLPPE